MLKVGSLYKWVGQATGFEYVGLSIDVDMFRVTRSDSSNHNLVHVGQEYWIGDARAAGLVLERPEP